jgi:putative transposase
MRLIVTPATILRWHRDIVRRWARLSRRGRVHGELAALGIKVAASTVWQILKDAGIDPAPRRNGPGWPEFLRSQALGILALDFFTRNLLMDLEDAGTRAKFAVRRHDRVGGVIHEYRLVA